MKISVIMGVIHISLGILCKVTNSIFFGNYNIFFTEVFAGLVILLGLFGWMDALIIANGFIILILKILLLHRLHWEDKFPLKLKTNTVMELIHSPWEINKMKKHHLLFKF